MNLLERYGLLIVMLGSALVALVAASNDSLWIDEGGWACAAIGVEKTVGDLDGVLNEWKTPRNWVQGSDPAKPFYGVYLWSWEKIFGHTERSLRLANLPWFLLAQAALWMGLKDRKRLRVVVALCVAICPIVWFYLNETSHYIMLFAGASLTIAILARLATAEEEIQPLGAPWFWAFGTGLLLLCGSNAMGVPWAGVALLAALLLLVGRFKIRWSWGTVLAVVFCGGALLALAEHYHHWNPARSGMVTGFSLMNVGFGAYELVGFAGLGPSRLVLREGGMSALRPFLPGLALMAVMCLLVVGAAFRQICQRFNTRMWIAAATYVLIGLVLVLAMAALTHFKLLGRHLMPVEPVVILGVAIAITAWLNKRKLWGRILVVGFCLLWLTSSLSLRFAPRHARDDYRSAAALAVDALQAGKSVWWAANISAGAYYQVPLAIHSPVPGRALLVANPTLGDLADVPLPDVVIFSKPDIYDAGGTLGKLLADHSYRNARSLAAFTVWEKQVGSGD